jgi:LmbE family N-acetylglucosaminyl deacetylase
MNLDHCVTAKAVLTAFRPLPDEQRPVTLLAFETLSSTEWNVPTGGATFAPNWFEDASPGLQRKIDAMVAYRHELCEWPHPRSLEGIRLAARRWGMTVGLEAAEAFMLLRRVG